MTSRTTTTFGAAFDALPVEIKRQARRAYRLFRQDPQHPSLRFKRVHPSQPIYSVRVSGGFRAVGIRADDEIVWFWIGSHADYDRLLKRRPHKA